LRLLAKQYPSIRAAATEVINLNGSLHLPKGTEHFISDVHGEYEAFVHVLKSGSGSIKRRIRELFRDELTPEERRTLATLVYYPEQKLPLVLKEADDEAGWYRATLARLIRLCRDVASKYTRAEVRAALPEDFAGIIDELMYEQERGINKEAYYRGVTEAIITTGSAPAFIAALGELVQHLAIARLHVIGDIYDRGPGAHIILDRLMDYHAVDVQWGNHDIMWMGAAAGSAACIANVIRVNLRYANTETLETGYAVNLLPLATFAMTAYADDPCELFQPKGNPGEEFTENEIQLMARMQKAIAIIQFKLEGQIVQRRPHYHMEDRLLLDKIDLEAGTVRVGEQTYPLLDTHFPTLDPTDPYALSDGERVVVDKLLLSFAHSEKLQRHVRFLFSKGGMYLIHNDNLLYHGCIPMNPDGSFRAFEVDGETYAARAFMDRVDRLTRQGYFATDPEQKEYGQDVMWYLWSGSQSPLFGKAKMATFERYFIADESTHVEEKDPYYDFRDQEETARAILTEFGVDPDKGHIINGHVPVKVKEGESPVKCGGRLLVIDGGFAEAYHDKTGIAGYTLIYNSYGLLLASHQPFQSTQKAIEEGADIRSNTRILEESHERIRVSETDEGRERRQRIAELEGLLAAYRSGMIKESGDFA
jgi:fructose-1,6-bisphosphatase-3